MSDDIRAESHETPASTRRVVIEMHKTKILSLDISRVLKRSRDTTLRWIKRFGEEENLKHLCRTGRPRYKIRGRDELILDDVARHPLTTAFKAKKEIGLHASFAATRRWLHDTGIYHRSPATGPLLTQDHKRQRVDLVMSVPKVIIDTDAGLDDALAIFMALAAHKKKQIEVIAITTVQGNTKVENVNSNVLRILETANLLGKIPVFRGASKALVHPWKHIGEPFHGLDGFGDAEHSKEPPPSSALQEEHAVWALTNLAKKYSGKVILTALGPLTNIALAIRLDSTFLSHLADIYVMGGNTSGEGNITMSGEFNFTCDPEAAKVVLEEVSKPIYLAPWEICLYQTGLPYAVRLEMGSVNTPEAALMNVIEARVNSRRQFTKWITCDQLAMAWMLDNVTKPENWNGEAESKNCDPNILALSTKTCYAAVELQGSMTRGQMVIDHIDQLKKPSNLIVLTGVNMPLYQRSSPLSQVWNVVKKCAPSKDIQYVDLSFVNCQLIGWHKDN
ncbi:nucleoside hydrolase-like isoform X3 [Macrobrachium rosenbergii]|uniref:nucleoside hydrolase-like isoform X3 n=1 Tax=Macrobrachium rosenbergii TaxID=79674 RepID=UPI0034D79034